MRLNQNESGQTQVEYVLVLAVGLVIFLTVLRTLILPVVDRMSEALRQSLENKLFQNFHHLRLKR